MDKVQIKYNNMTVSRSVPGLNVKYGYFYVWNFKKLFCL